MRFMSFMQDAWNSFMHAAICLSSACILQHHHARCHRLLTHMPCMHACSVIMVDEVHERTVATDLLLGLLKRIQRRRPDLRIIISSATLEAQSIASFFDTRSVRRGSEAEQPERAGAPLGKPAIMSVEGRLHNVQVCQRPHAPMQCMHACLRATWAG